MFILRQDHFFALTTMLIQSEHVKKALSTSHRQFRRFFGVKRQTFLFIRQAVGSVHDLTLYKESIGSAVGSDVKIKVDSGYQGIVAFHTNSVVPFKKSKNRPLTKEEKAFNRQLARECIAIEHVNREIKIFKIMSDRYRNRRRRHGLRLNLICAIRNSEITHSKG